ncbi:MAG: CpaF family protein, partial [Candidatus Diapherotrites archaeon]|nr:CpaF family protein [Candidatus Diapherotrites archaeon]
ENALEELTHSGLDLKGKGDVYFFLKNYCIENLILLGKEQREKILQLLEWEALGESILTPLLKDPDFEEIVINGSTKPIMVYHHVFGWLQSNCYFTNDQKIKTILNKMASTLGRQLSYSNPILDTVLVDGSRLNASMDPIAFSGINATIRKFKENPMTPKNIIEMKTINEKATAFLWLAMQTSCSVLVCGNTGSGKTTTLNSLFCFLPSKERVVVVEETPEIVLPQEHKVKLNTSENIGVGLEKLIENTFRMRPDRVIVGEVRSQKECKGFVNTMLAGQAKGSYATFHAESALEALQRMQSMGVEKDSLDSIDLIVVQKRIQKISKSGHRKEERKVTEICEIEKEGKLRTLFEFDYNTGKLKEKNKSVRILNKIMQTFSINKTEYDKLLHNKEICLKKMNGKTTFKDFFKLAEVNS